MKFSTPPAFAADIESREGIVGRQWLDALPTAVLDLLHFENVLAGDREPWLAIDPKGLTGDPAFESVAVLWNRMEEYGNDPRSVLRRLAAWCEAAGVAREPARAWARAHIVEDALDRLSRATGPERDVSAHEFLVAALVGRP